MRLELHESNPADRMVASRDLERAIRLESELRALYARCGHNQVLTLLSTAIVQSRQAEEHYRYLHRPARPFATIEQIEQLRSERAA